MTYYGINHYDQQYRRDFYKLYPDALGLFHRETDKRRREAVGKGWTYVQEREHAKNFESLGADWTYEHDGIFLLDFLRDPKAQSRPSSDSRGYSGSKSKAAPSCGTCGKLGRWFDTLETNLDELAVAAKRCTVCGLLAKGCRDAGALSEEVKVEVRMNSEGVVAFVLEVGLGRVSFSLEVFQPRLSTSLHLHRGGRLSRHPDRDPAVARGGQPFRPLPRVAPRLRRARMRLQGSMASHEGAGPERPGCDPPCGRPGRLERRPLASSWLVAGLAGIRVRSLDCNFSDSPDDAGPLRCPVAPVAIVGRAQLLHVQVQPRGSTGGHTLL